MRLLTGILTLSLGVASALAPQRSTAQAASTQNISGTWQGFALTADKVEVPITVQIRKHGSTLSVSLLNGPIDYPDSVSASSVTFEDAHLVASFDYFARTLDATLSNGVLNGTYGATRQGLRGPLRTSFTAKRVTKPADPIAAANAPDISGSWDIPTRSSKGESAWELVVDKPSGTSPVIKTAIQRIDGDTGGLWGVWNGTNYTVAHFTAAGPAAYSITPRPDGTLVLKNLVSAPTHGASVELVAHRSADAHKENLPAPTDPAQQTSMKDPNAPFIFGFPDLNGKTVANTDPEFRGKVVIVAIGGSWCPNCHDEAPFLVSLYKKFHARGLEIVNIDFEQGEPDTDIPRLKAFIAHYGIEYPVLLGGTTDQLQDKISQVKNLNCWPTSFFIGRDGLVKLTHAGFAGPGNTQGHATLEKDVTALVEKLLVEPVSVRSAANTDAYQASGR
jgi:thiol-disulfide isomerase/thioredoxin